MLYEADPTAGYVVGVDIGREWIRVAAADLSGDDRRPPRRAQPRSQRRRARAVASARSRTTWSRPPASTWKRVAHTVVGGPGVFDPDSGRLWHAPEPARLEPAGRR